MNLSEPFIRRPIATTLLMVALLLFGVIAYRGLPVSDLPNIDFPTIQVTASLPGANPETMASSVATPLERQFSSIPGLEGMTSSSTQGSTQVTLQFALERSIDTAAQDVQTALSAASRLMPPGMPSPPSFRKVNPAESPILFLSLNSKTLPLSRVNEVADTMLAQRISAVDGVAQVQVFGSQKYAVRLQMDPRALAARGVGLEEVTSAIQQGNANLPTGTLWGPKQAFTVQAEGQLTNAEAFGDLVVTYRNGSPVHLKELGRIRDSVENNRQASWYNGRRGVVLAVQRQPGSNTIKVADHILELLPQMRRQIPAAINLELVYNRAETIRASVRDVQLTLLLAVGMVVVVIFGFLRNLSATLIPSLALPGSIVATFAGMKLLGFNLDNLSLMALTLATGFVVDDAIVMLENIVRHVEAGEPPLQAALKGAREIGFTIVAMTVSLVAVFIPVLLMGGIMGRLFNEFGVTLSLSILVSGLLALTLTPMLAARFLRPHTTHGRAYMVLERGFEGMRGLYDGALRLVLRHRRLTALASLALVGVTAWQFVAIPKGFIPTEDINQLMGSTQAAPGTSFDQMVRHQQALVEIVRKNPNVKGVMSSVGAGGRNPTANAGTMVITLKPRHERPNSAEEVVAQLRPQLGHIPGIKAFLQIPPTIRIGGQMTRSAFQLSLKSTDQKALEEVTPKLTEQLRVLPELMDVSNEMEARTPQLSLAIDRERAAMLGVSATQIQNVLYSAYGNRQISQIYAPTNQYQVILEVAPEFQLDPEALSSLYVRSSSGKLIPLSNLVELTRGVGPVAVTHNEQMPSTTLSFNLKPGVALSDAMAQVKAVTQDLLPPEVSFEFRGAAQAFQSSLKGMGVLLILAVVVIYLVLGILYESYIHPLTVLSGLPSAGLGALTTLMLFGKELDIYGFMGLLLLIGIVKKNAIMMIDVALERQKEGLTAQEAIYEACLLRFRPIMMTTFAALFGSLPIALGLGAGGEARQALGLAVVGGLAVSQLLTLFITPVVYVYLDRLNTRRRPPELSPRDLAAPTLV